MPTPPTAKIDNFSVKGSSIISFSEDVFILPNLDKMKVKVPRKRQLNQELEGKFSDFEYDEYPFIEVKVDPGENSDPSKLGFSYTAKFIDAKNIEIDVTFENPTYVSAYQPEDYLIVTFWGPFYD